MEGGRLLAEINVQTGNTHSERLMPQIEELFTLTGADAAQVEAVAASIGPGSFTGLRIGLSTAKMLAYIWQKPIIGVPTMESLAYACPACGGFVSPLLDAQKGRVYQALYQWEAGKLDEIWPVRIVSAEAAFQELAALDCAVMVVGESAHAHAGLISGEVQMAPKQFIMPRAASVAFLGQEKWRQGLAVPAAELNPYYVRRAEAEELWERRCGAAR